MVIRRHFLFARDVTSEVRQAAWHCSRVLLQNRAECFERCRLTTTMTHIPALLSFPNRRFQRWLVNSCVIGNSCDSMARRVLR